MNYPDVVNNWSKLYLDGIEDRTILDFLKNSNKTDDIIYYYQSYQFRKSMSSKSTSVRWWFVDDFANATLVQKAELRNDINIANGWERLRFEPNLSTEFKTLSIADKIEISKKFGKIEEKLFEGFKKNPAKILEYKSQNIAGRKLLEDSMHFWLIHDLDYMQVKRLDQNFLTEAYKKILQKKPADWFTNPANKERAIKDLSVGNVLWENGKALEILSEKFLKKQFLNPNTEIITGVDIKLIRSNGNEIKTNNIQEIDFVVINKSTNEIDLFGSIKMQNKRHDYVKDKNKIIEYWYNLPNSGVDLTQFISTKLAKSNDFLQATSAMIKGTNLRTGLPFEELPSVFKTRIKSESYYVTDKFKKVDANTLNTSSTKIAEQAYNSLLNKF